MAPDHCNNDEPGNVSCVGQHACTGGNPMTERNYACDGPIRLFFGNHTAVDLAATGEAAFKGQLCVPTSLRARAPLKRRLPPLNWGVVFDSTNRNDSALRRARHQARVLMVHEVCRRRRGGSTSMSKARRS